jgi:hypothetical protein
MNRHRAAAIHLSLSAAIGGALLALILLLWYPGAWFESMGGKELILLLVGVDIVLGPLLTWIIFRAGKPGLKFDLAVIAAVQTGALLYGLHTVFIARPVYMVLVADQFRAVTAVELDEAQLARLPHAEFRELPLTGPRVAGTFLPTDKAERENLLLMSVARGIDLQQLPQYWQPYAGAAALRVARTLAELRGIAPENAAAVDAFLREGKRAEASLRYLPLRTRHKEMAALVDAGSGAVVGILDARPWR